MQTYLLNALIFCGLILLLTLSVAAVQLIFILNDTRQITRQAREKVAALGSLFDIVALIFGGLGFFKERGTVLKEGSNLTAFLAGLKKALQVMLGSKKEEK